MIKITAKDQFTGDVKVTLAVLSKTPEGVFLYPGEYTLDEIPDAAIAAGIVYKKETPQPTNNEQETEK